MRARTFRTNVTATAFVDKRVLRVVAEPGTARHVVEDALESFLAHANAEAARERARLAWADWDEEEIDREFLPWPAR